MLHCLLDEGGAEVGSERFTQPAQDSTCTEGCCVLLVYHNIYFEDFVNNCWVFLCVKHEVEGIVYQWTLVFHCKWNVDFQKPAYTSAWTSLVCGVQRRAVVSGEVEPTDDECEWHSEGEEEELSVSICLLHICWHFVESCVLGWCMNLETHQIDKTKY